jgi:hypothetical protein
MRITAKPATPPGAQVPRVSLQLHRNVKASALVVTCPKCQKNGHTLENCWRDEVSDICGNTGHIAKVCQLLKDVAPAAKSVTFEKTLKVRK